ncbi:Outer membrane biosynthesis protein TonB OS=Streptomyces griseomycini OX=66895 GN=FHS37_006594 PE=4 SV=1 [Streptomyces griseomycini]
MILLAGPEKTGKSRIAAEGTASELLGMTYWIEIGGSEGTADYYGRIPGANYEIVPHDGSYQDILDAVRWAVAQPPAVEGKRNMIVVDNVSVLWDMLSDEQAIYARWRAEKRAKEDRRRGPNPDLPVTVDPDLWNRAKDRWGEILWHLRRHSGPTLLLARQELVIAFENDKPTRERTRKIKAEKNLPAAVDAIVELHALGEAYLTGVRTLHWEVTPGQSERFEKFSIDALLRRMGFHEAAATRQVTEARPEAYLDEQQAQQTQQTQQRPPQQSQQRNQRQQQEAPPAQQSTQKAGPGREAGRRANPPGAQGPDRPREAPAGHRARSGAPAPSSETPDLHEAMRARSQAPAASIARSLAYVEGGGRRTPPAGKPPRPPPPRRARRPNRDTARPAPRPGRPLAAGPPARRTRTEDDDVRPCTPDPRPQAGPPPGESPAATSLAEGNRRRSRRCLRARPGSPTSPPAAAQAEPDRKTKIVRGSARTGGGPPGGE